MTLAVAAVSSRAVAASSSAAAAGGAARRVAVIGAGFAGLAAALSLQRSGRCEVTVLEASQRAGGRACTQQVGDAAIELGATWFHGLGTPERPNPVFKHAVDQGLIGSSPEAETWWNSQFLLPGVTEPLSKDQQLAVTHALAAWTATVDGLPADASGTTADHLRGAWASLLASGKLQGGIGKAEAAAGAWRWRELLQRAMDGCHSTSDQSALGLSLYDEMEGGVHCALPAGMQTVAENLAAQLSDLRYGHEVERIAWGPAGVRILCANGETLEADAAIVTVSLGVLQARHGELFEPALPPGKVGAIKRLRAGVVDKVFLEFEQPGGSASAAAGSAAAGNTSDGSSSKRGAATDAGVPGGASWGDSEPAVSYALLWSCPWEAEDGTSSGAGAAAASASLAGATAAGCEACVPDWARGIFSLRFGGPEFKHAGRTASSKGQQQTDAAQRSQAAEQAAAGGTAATGDGAAAREAGEEAPEDAEFSPCAEAAQPTCYQAVAWVTGEAALAMEAAPDEEVLGVLRQLGDIFPQLQLPPGASWDRVTLRRSRWGSDPLFRGSYAYLGPNCSPADVAALAAPVYASSSAGSSSAGGSDAGSAALDGSGGSGGASCVSEVGPPALLFAGEACHVVYIGTMHGAYLTGQQAAENLLRHWHYQQGQQQEQKAAREQEQETKLSGRQQGRD